MHDVIFFVLGYYIHLIANCILIYKISRQRSVYGLSIDTQICFLLSVLSRCCWTLETRLVETKFAYMELGGSIIAAFTIVALCWQFRITAGASDKGPFRVYFLVPGALFAATVLHPGDDIFTIQILVAFTMYIEAAGLLPQLWLMRRMHEIESLTSHYVGLLVVSRACRMIFWVVLFWMGERFWMLFAADLIHLCLAGDYMLLWIKKLKDGGQLVYSSSSTNV